MEIVNLCNISAGLLMLIRTWMYYNYLLLKEDLPGISLIKYLKIDKNIVFNYWLVKPIIERPTKNELVKMRNIVNLVVFFIYILIIIEIIL